MTSLHPLQLLVPAKVAPPSPGAALVTRERLLNRLNSLPSARLTLVVAPAGFGKSTLVAQWLSMSPLPVAWLTLDEYDQDARQVLAYLVGAILRVLPGALPSTGQLLAAPEPPPPYVIVQSLLVELSALPTEVVLVLDDYHSITDATLHQTFNYLLRQLPATCRLVVLSRSEPPFPLVRLRTAQQLVEVRGADLRFTHAEAATLVAAIGGRVPDDALVAALQAETEGWAIALQLATLAALEATQKARSPHTPATLTEYLAEEVLLRQSLETQTALLALAVPERVCAGLAAVLLGMPDEELKAEHVLDQLVRANLLLIPLDTEGRWYRFHHLFRDLLLRRLSLGSGRHALGELQLRAAGWLEREGLFAEAVRCYLAAGADDAAGALVERLLAPDLGRRLTPVGPAFWLRLLPAELIARRPGLALLEARIGFATLNIPMLAVGLAQVARLLAAAEGVEQPPPWATFPNDYKLLCAVLDYVERRLDTAIPVLEAVLDNELGLGLTGQALMVLGRAYVAAGWYAEGVKRFEARRLAQGQLPGRLGELSHGVALCAMHGLAGSLDDLGAEAVRLNAVIAESRAGDTWICSAAANLGRVAYERSDLPTAAAHFHAVIARRYQTNAAVTIGSLIGLALIAARQGADQEAAGYEQEARALAVEVGSPFAQNEVMGCAARIALIRGDLAAALGAAREIRADPQIGSSSWYALESPQVCKAAVFLAANDAELLSEAEATLLEVVARLEALHNARPLVCALATFALLRQAQGRIDEALTMLQRAVSIAAARGYVRALLDRGSALRPLLERLAGRSEEREYLARVLAVFEPVAYPIPRPQIAPIQSEGRLEMLTGREQEVLALLAERWSDKEIAARLVIALNTVRKHTTTLYAKLGVSNRREAVDAARALGLLPSR